MSAAGANNRSARKDNTNYTGKTYNSADSIAEFFKQRSAQLGNTSGSFPRPDKPSKVQSPKSKVRRLPPEIRNRSAIRPADFVPGSYVMHAKYGRGLVLRREGVGDSMKLTVTFPGYGQKKLVQKYAGLEKA